MRRSLKRSAAISIARSGDLEWVDPFGAIPHGDECGNREKVKQSHPLGQNLADLQKLWAAPLLK